MVMSRVKALLARLAAWSPSSRARWLALLLGSAALIAMTEVDRLIARSTASGAEVTVAGLCGPGAFGRTDEWTAWAGAQQGDREAAARLIRMYVVADLAFVACYFVALVWLAWLAGSGLRGLVRVLIGILVSAETVEAVALLVAARRVWDGSDVDVTATWIAGAATAKWLAVLAVLVTLGWALCRRRTRNATGRFVKDYAEGVWAQRLSVLVVVILAIAAVVPVSGALDQIPDAQRRWLDDAPTHLWSVALGFAAAAFITGIVYFTSRSRSELGAWYALRPSAMGAEMKPALLWPWWVLAALWLGAALIWASVTAGDRVTTTTAGTGAAVLATVAIASAVTRMAGTSATEADDGAADVGLALISGWVIIGVAVATEMVSVGWTIVGVAVSAVAVGLDHWRRVSFDGTVTPVRDPDSRPTVFCAEQRAWRIQAVGQASVVLVVAVFSLGAVRAFSGPTAAGIAHGDGGSLRSWSVLMFTLGLLILWILGWRGARWIARTAVPLPRGEFPKVSRRAQILGRVVVIGALIAAVAFIVGPMWTSSRFGVVGTITVTIGAIVALLAAAILALQYRRPPEVFSVTGMQAVPVLTLVLILAVIPTLDGGDRKLHRIRYDGYEASVKRPDLAAAFKKWVEAPSGCLMIPRAVSAEEPGALPGGVRVRPMLIVAASGGGIRAAVWTTNSLASVAENTQCGSDVVFASSGVSGGAVGLAMTRALDNSGVGAPADWRAAAAKLTSPDALAAGLGGTVLTDTFASITGLRFSDGADGRWRDRAALIEETWESEVPALADAFDWSARGRPTGALLLNSATENRKCRVVVSQVELPAGSTMNVAGSNANGCLTADGRPASTIDFASFFAGCVPKMNWSTAAMLAARFPFVTPSGRVFAVPGVPWRNPHCRESLQLVDGGYVEGEGLSLISELAPDLAQLIDNHNRESSDVFVVPMVLYLNDEPKPTPAKKATGGTPETLIPFGFLGGSTSLTDAEAWMQRITAAFDDVCGGKPQCVDARQDLMGRITTPGRSDMQAPVNGSIITMAPPILGTMEVPLGWTLSTRSRESLERASGSDSNPLGCDAPHGDDLPPDQSAGLLPLRRLLCPAPVR